MTYNQKSVVDAIRAFERGEIVVVTDDDGRENEGDLIVAAVHCTPEKMAFIVRHTSGIVCAPMPKDEAKRLGLAPMVADNDSAHHTAFTVTVDFRHGTTTGISAEDRSLTVRNLANPNVGADDFVRPGHVFPLISREGGVLMRSGHTEAAVDLCKLSGLPPIGVIGELVNDDGTVKHGMEVSHFATENNLHCVTVADLIAYRQRQETLIEHVGEMAVETIAGQAIAHSYQLPWEPMQHVAIVIGDIRDGENIPVRLHRENVITDVFGKNHDVETILCKMAEKEKRGVFVYLREGSVGVGANGHERYLEMALEGQENHQQAVERDEEWRQIGLGAQILKHLGIGSVILYASRERHYVGLQGFGIQISKTDIL
ncbi:3,4-dihydroxy-2-butanone-4-phosphate synthase [Bartonella tamiae]|uniref:3,4-dihydroxy-2-butanone 4-phosphate synthase n=1 Tax=Bartonella tamiae Th239 TaxID=1094558 RepID=J0QWW4_9HYPH|nr:3,4-dihydroxy-2-butanone-4-phosphate synthase [Bartonella tamiae]EJF90521.1 3,4-dihydroxy-2-butanone-4-phosphate synthase [Bartonella tamiae Th239]